MARENLTLVKYLAINVTQAKLEPLTFDCANVNISEELIAELIKFKASTPVMRQEITGPRFIYSKKNISSRI